MDASGVCGRSFGREVFGVRFSVVGLRQHPKQSWVGLITECRRMFLSLIHRRISKVTFPRRERKLHLVDLLFALS